MAEEFEGYQTHTPESRRISLALFLAGVATFALLYDTQALLPQISETFHIRAEEAALSVSFATIGLAVALLFAGPLSEVIGRRKVMFIGMGVASILGILTGLVPNWHAHLGMRLAMGIFLSGLPAVAMAYLVEELHPKAQTSTAGLYIGGTALGGMTGRLVCGFISDHFGWQVALTAMGVVSAACAVSVMLLLPKSRGFHPAPAKLGLLWYNTWHVFADPGIRLLYVVAACGMGALVGVFNILAYRLEGSPYNLNPGLISLIFLVYILGSVSSTEAGRLASRFGQRAVAPWGAVLMLVGVLLTLVSPVWGIIAAMGIFTIGFFAMHGITSGWVAARASAGVGAAGQASSGYMFFYYAGSSLFGALAGSAWSHFAWPGVVGLAGALSLVSLLALLWLRRIPSLADKSGPAYDSRRGNELK